MRRRCGADDEQNARKKKSRAFCDYYCADKTIKFYAHRKKNPKIGRLSQEKI